MSETPQPNWYPDPYGQAELRWWDGAQWTEHTHGGGTQPPQAAEQHDAAHQATALAHEGHAPKRKKTWLIVTASVAALALVTAGAIAIPALIGGQNFGAAEPVIANGIKYMPPVTLDVAKDDTLHLDLNVDYFELSERLQYEGDSVTFNHGIVELYADRDLTVPVDTYVDGFDGKLNLKPLQAIDYASKADDVYADDLGLETTFFDKNLPWSEYASYWVKRSYGVDGEKLEMPEVTQVIPKYEEDRPAPIDIAFSKGATDGSVKITWIAPEGADKSTEYLVLKSGPTMFSATETEGWQTDIIGKVTGETSYDSSDFQEFKGTQNAGFNLYSGNSADEEEYGPEGTSGSTFNATNARISVVAKQGKQYSPSAPVAPDASVRSLPLKVADWQISRTRDETQKWNTGDLTGLETWIPVTTLDGATRSMQVQIDPDSLNPDVVIQNYGENGGFVYPDGVGMKATILGTTLTESYASYVPAGMSKAEWMEQLKSHIANFNARSISEQAKTGAVLTSVEDADRSIDVEKYRALTAATKTPKVDYPVFGTHSMVEHIAANMYAGELAIDVSKWRDEPGAPAPYAAYREAMTQNPLLNYGSPLMQVDGQKIYIDYIFDQTDREAAMDLSYDKAKEVAASVEGKSDEEKAKEINQWVIDNTEYDYDSLAELVGDQYFGSTSNPLGRIDPDSEYTAWSPIGVFRDGTAVCMGYAQAYTLIAREANLDSVIVLGDVTAGGGHAWNRVSIDGTWKSLDPTWNDSESSPNKYLLINESEYVDSATRTTDPADNWILDINKSKYDTP